MATRITHTQGAATSRRKFTLSAWIKRGTITDGHDQVIYDSYNDGNNRVTFFIHSTDHLYLYSASGGSVVMEVVCTRKLRDCGGWYHIVCAVDTEQSTASDRVKIYVNNQLETSFSTATYPSQNLDLRMGTADYTDAFGYYSGGGSSVFEGCMSHLQFVDGAQLTPNYFGQTDATTGEWKFGGSAGSITYGNNGFHILKDGNSLTDQSGNTNNFTLNTGTLTKTEDNPSNSFATLNTMRKVDTSGTFANGNLKYTRGDNTWVSAFSTLGFNKGKFYYEAEFESGSYFKLGFVSEDSVTGVGHIGQAAIDAGYAWYMNDGGEVRTDDAVVSGWGGGDITNISTITTGDIMKVAVDMDNKFAYFGVNNVWAKNADPTSGSSGTGGFPISSEYTSGQEQKLMIPAVSVYAATCHVNFGNGYFGTTAVSSAGTNASGHGIFEHDVPAGYTAVCTKGINSF